MNNARERIAIQPVKTLFWDIGGVLLSNGWDRDQRAIVLAQFGMDYGTFEADHHLIVSELESGRLTLDDYLNQTAFSSGKNPCTRAAFIAAMQAQSTPHPDTLQLAKELHSSGLVRMFALNNESRELNAYRIKTFELGDFLLGFFSSCYLRLSKPNPNIYRLALELAHCEAADAVMIDDRAQNVEAARSVGMKAIHHTDAANTRAALQELGISLEDMYLEGI
jgi:putative hydrolase of the HAD superfamily